MGPLPPTGQWVRLEVPASEVGLDGAAISGMAFTLYDGRATWDSTGIALTPLLSEIDFSNAAFSIGEAGTEAIITVHRSGSTNGSATVDYATSDGSATAGSDYVATNGTLIFADGETNKTFSVAILDDDLTEVNETVELSLSGPTGTELGEVSNAVLTITDNDRVDFAWVDDSIPVGAVPGGSWTWISSGPIPYSGSLAHRSTLAAGMHQHYFFNAPTPLQIQAGDTLYA
jgi:hypothetical protein